MIHTLSAAELTKLGDVLEYARHDIRSKIFMAQSDSDEALSAQIITQQKSRLKQVEALEAAVKRELAERRAAGKGA